MSPEPPPPDMIAPPEPPPADSQAPERYPFWGYLDLLGFLFIALLGVLVESLLVTVLIPLGKAEKIYVILPMQLLLYGFLLGTLAWMFRRYYGRPFWQSLGWVPANVSTHFVAGCGIAVAFATVFASVLLRTPDLESPMKTLLSDPTSALLIAVLGTTLAPVCEEILFRGFLQPLLVRSLGAAGGVLLAAVLFGLMHLREYANSWRHALLITMAGAGFGWMRQRTGSTKAAALMHAAYNGVFFALLVVQRLAMQGR